MNIGLIHFRVGETDGVSLEMEKWKYILEKLGHTVWYIAGSGEIEDVLYMKGLHYQNPTNTLLVNHIYRKAEDGYSGDDIKTIYLNYAQEIENELHQLIDDYQIDMIIPNNILSLGWNIAAGKAISEVIEKTGVKVIAHHHDFYWERELYSQPKYRWVEEVLENYFPPKNDNVSHVVINNLAQKSMMDKKSLKAVIVPNVFDFEQNWMLTDGYNSKIRQELALKKTDIVLLQGTRVVARKGIELTLRSMHYMNERLPNYIGKKLYNGEDITPESRIILVLVGLNEDEEYYQKLKALALNEQVDILDVSHRIDFERKSIYGEKIFSLWDAYQLADLVSYPSLLEGFGNQLLEAVYANKPFLIYEYPVYKSYLKHFGLSAISFGDDHELDQQKLAIVTEDISIHVAEKALEILTSSKEYEAMTKRNYDICLREFSYKKLYQLLNELIGKKN